MYSNNQLTTIYLFSLLFFFQLGALQAQTPLKIDSKEVAGIAEQLICHYPNSIDLGEGKIIRFLQNMLTVPSKGTGYYAPPIPQLSSDRNGKISFKWKKVPNASEYSVGSLNLNNGQQKIQSTATNTLSIKRSQKNAFLYAFVSSGPLGSKKEYVECTIIFADKDLGFADNDSRIGCLCDRPPITAKEDFSRCAYERSLNAETYIFQWTNNCPINKYRFKLTGTLGEQEIETYYTFLFDQSNYLENVIHNFSECNPNIPTHFFSPKSLEGQITQAVNVYLTGESVRFELMEDLLDQFEVQGQICGCYTSLDRSAIKEANTTIPLRVSPNPFTDQITIDFQLGNEKEEDLELRMFDTKGHLVLQQNQKKYAGQQQIKLSTAFLDKGLYHLQLTTSHKVYQQKLIKL